MDGVPQTATGVLKNQPVTPSPSQDHRLLQASHQFTQALQRGVGERGAGGPSEIFPREGVLCSSPVSPRVPRSNWGVGWYTLFHYYPHTQRIGNCLWFSLLVSCFEGLQQLVQVALREQEISLSSPDQLITGHLTNSLSTDREGRGGGGGGGLVRGGDKRR